MVRTSELVALQQKYTQLQKNFLERDAIFQVSFSQAPVGMAQCGLDGQIWKVNRTFCQMVGYSEEELRSRSFEDLTHPEDLNLELSWARRLVAAQIETYSLKKRYLRKDGSIAPVSLQVNLVRDAQGMPHSVIGFVEELPPPPPIETPTLKQQQLLNAFFRRAASGLAIFDENLRFVQVNQTFAQMMGTTETVPINKTLGEIIPGMAGDIQTEIEKVWRDRTAQVGRAVDGEIPAEPGVQQSWEVSCFPLMDQQGGMIGIGCSIDPIEDEVQRVQVERQRAEAALHEYEARFQRVAKSLPGVVYQYRQHLNPADDFFTYISPACREVYGVEPEAVLENSQIIWDLIHPEDKTGFIRSFLEAAQRGKEWRYEWRIIPPSGNIKWLQGAAKITPQGEGVTIWDGVVLEITDRKLADDSLQQQIKMLDLANDCIMIRDLNDKIQYCNQGVQRLYGWSHQEVMGQYIHDFLQTQFPQPLSQIMDHCLREGHWRGELVHTRRDGTEIVVESRWTLQRDVQNHPVAILELNTDISDRKQAEVALKNSEARFRTTFEQAAVGVAHVDFDGRFIRINQRFCDIVGYSKTEMLDLTFQEITHAEDLAVDWELAQQVKREQISHYSIEKRYIRKDRSLIWVNLTVAMEQERNYWISVIEDISDRKQAEAARLQSEIQLREKMEREKLLNRLTSQIRNSLDLNTILQTVVTELQRVLNLDRCYFLWHHSEPTASWFCVEEAKRTHLKSFLGEYPIQENNPLHLKMMEREILWCDDLVASPDPNWHSIYTEVGFTAVLFVPLRKSQDQLGVIGCVQVSDSRHWKPSEIELIEAVRDCMEIAIFQAELYQEATMRSQELEQALKELQKTQTQLIQSEKMASLGQLVAGIAHEINNPVSFIFGNISHGRDYLCDLLAVMQLYDTYYPNPVPAIVEKREEVDLEFLTEDFGKLLDSMEQGAIRIREIVTSLRTFSRFDEAALKEVDIHEGLESTLMILKNRLESRGQEGGIEVIKTYGRLPRVECFASELNQVFINILANAIDAIEESSRQGEGLEGGKIWITTQVLEGNQIAIQIKDNGCGIPEQSIPRLYDPFFTTKPIGQGTGLGLATSYQIVVDRHKGKLKCSSKTGTGTEFLIELPIYQVQCGPDEFWNKSGHLKR
jgi:PAS domain S-box-containing protein